MQFPPHVPGVGEEDRAALAATFVIYDERCEVIAYKKGKVTWHASGDYRGQPIHIKGARSAEQAFDHWKSRAQAIVFD